MKFNTYRRKNQMQVILQNMASFYPFYNSIFSDIKISLKSTIVTSKRQDKTKMRRHYLNTSQSYAGFPTVTFSKILNIRNYTNKTRNCIHFSFFSLLEILNQKAWKTEIGEAGAEKAKYQHNEILWWHKTLPLIHHHQMRPTPNSPQQPRKEEQKSSQK